MCRPPPPSIAAATPRIAKLRKSGNFRALLPPNQSTRRKRKSAIIKQRYWQAGFMYYPTFIPFFGIFPSLPSRRRLDLLRQSRCIRVRISRGENKRVPSFFHEKKNFSKKTFLHFLDRRESDLHSVCFISDISRNKWWSLRCNFR